MLTSSNAFSIAIKGRQLYETEGNCGRKLRRFLNRVLESSQMVHQVFIEPAVTNAIRDSDLIEDFPSFSSVCEYARIMHDLNMSYITDDDVSAIGTVFDRSYDLVQNTYGFKTSTDQASLKELKQMLRVVIILAEHLELFAFNPAKAVHDAVMHTVTTAIAFVRQEQTYRVPHNLAALFKAQEAMTA